MKMNTERKYIWNFLKATVMIGVTLALLMPGSATFANYNKTAKVQASVNTIISSTTHNIIYVDDTTIFTIENPPVDFEVVDADPFDGFGDSGPYSTFNNALLGTLGECRSMAEFDISPFGIPSGEFISLATFEVMITEIDVFGLGVDGETPESLAVDGYVGNGLEELSDFEAGDGNVLDSVDTPDPQIGQVLSFNVTSFVTDLVDAQEQYVGLTIRAETFGGLQVEEGSVYPKLTIEIENQPPNNPSTPSGSTFLNIDESGIYSTNATDPDGNQVQYRFDWDANGSHDYSDWTDFVSSGTTVSMNHSWSNGGSYVVKAQARDIFNETSGWSNGLSVFVNSPPNTPSDPEPEDGATDVDVDADLSWSCSDPDGDNLTYNVYFEANDPTPDELVSENQSGTTYDPETMEYNTHYYWKIVAWDNHSASTEGPVWDFTTMSEPNDPPYPPSDPSPESGSIDVDIDVDLSWTGGDPNPGDTVVYDVYLEAGDPTPDVKIADDISEEYFDPGTLGYETTYYWQIVAKDDHGAVTQGPIWHFTTEGAPIPDLECEGTLSWTNVEPGGTVTGNFTVKNIGEPESLLDWEVETWPSWGTWTFDPLSGNDLPKDGETIVQVTVVAPDEQNEEFTGEVKVVNKDNSSDNCTIPTFLKTPYSKNNMVSPFLQFLKRVIQRFPILERLFLPILFFSKILNQAI